MEDCEEVACKTKINLFKQLKKHSYTKDKDKDKNKKKYDDKQSLIDLYLRQQKVIDDNEIGFSSNDNCPLDREELGSSTWGVLHTVAAYYPNDPNENDRKKGTDLVEALAHLYPCSHCREDFQREVERSPPRLASRKSFSLWVCEQHNAVNEKLGKPTFQCTLENLDERWRTGCKDTFEAVGKESASESLGQ